MTKRKIRYGNDPVLRSRCEEVKVVDNKILSLLGEMLETLHKTDNGAAIAANQVGILKRLVVIDFLGCRLKLVNPRILESHGLQECIEGCLSFPDRFAETIRPYEVYNTGIE
ncbi:peptide deformylase [Prevotella histicola]|jgi:peptide deformylase|uniref:peptide deformylase n=1 Tax=Prevotella histicola TaxID=470565 RepID=UPI003C749E11